MVTAESLPGPSSPHGAAAASGTEDAAPGWLQVSCVFVHRRLTLLVRGEADIGTADALRQQLTDAIVAWPHATVIDLSGLSFCGLAGLDAWRAAQEAGLALGRDVQVTGLSERTAWLEAFFPRPRRETGVGATPPGTVSTAPGSERVGN